MRTFGWWGVAIVLMATAVPASAQSKTSLVGGKTLTLWIAELKDRDPSIAENAVRALMLFGSGAQKEADPALIARLIDGDVSLRANAAMALGAIGLDPENMSAGVTALTRMLNDPQAIVRYHAAIALSRTGADARAAIPNLVYTIRDKGSWEIRKAAATALGTTGRDRMNMPDPRAIKALTDALGDWCAQVRMEAVQSMIQLGQPALLADRLAEIHALQPLLTDRDKVVAIWSRMALMRLDKIYDEHITSIARMLKNPDLRVRIQAAEALGMLGVDAKEHIPELIAALKDKEATGAEAAAQALVGMKEGLTPSALDGLAQLLTNPDPQVRCQAAWTLGMLGDRAQSRIPDLVEVLNDKDPAAAAAAAQALGDMGDVAQKAIPALTKLADQSNEKVRSAASQALAKISRKEMKPN